MRDAAKNQVPSGNSCGGSGTQPQRIAPERMARSGVRPHDPNSNGQKVTEMSSFDQATRNAERNMRKGQEAMQDTWSQMTNNFSTSAQGARQFHLKAVDMVRSHANSTFDLVEDLIAARSPDDVTTAWRSFIDRQSDAFSRQTSEFSSMTESAAKDSMQPVKEAADRFAKSA
jgi:hypothetical protein